MSPKNSDKLKPAEKLALRLTAWLGSSASIAVHTVLFAGSFSLWFFGVDFDSILLILTTLVSLEAIYLALFIQMTVNRNTQSLEEVEEDIDEIQKDVDEIQEDIDEVQKDVDEIQEDVEGIEKDVDEIQHDIDEVQEDVEEIQKDVDDVQENVEEMSEEEKQGLVDKNITQTLSDIQKTLVKLAEEVERLKK